MKRRIFEVYGPLWFKFAGLKSKMKAGLCPIKLRLLTDNCVPTVLYKSANQDDHIR